MRRTKTKWAITFQFALLLILALNLMIYPQFAEIIIGAFIGMLVGVGTENVDKIPDREDDGK